MSSDPGSTEEPVDVDVADAVATITLNRPKRLNAYTDGLGRRLHAVDVVEVQLFPRFARAMR